MKLKGININDDRQRMSLAQYGNNPKEYFDMKNKQIKENLSKFNEIKQKLNVAI
jgi:hypothetical protein